MRIHGVQLDSTWESPAENQARTRQLLREASLPPGGLIVLPEMFLTGFSLRTELTAQPEGSPQEAFLAELAQEHRCAVLGGLVVTDPAGGLPRNQALAFAPDGRLLARYTKQQPFSLGGETTVHAPGHRTVLFDHGGLRIAPLICYDLRFPELARAAALAGAELLVFIASWPIARVEHWLTLLRARAIENQAWVVGVNRCGRDPHFTYPGRSVIVDPHGTIIADAGAREHVLSADSPPSVVRDWRQTFPALQDAAPRPPGADPAP